MTKPNVLYFACLADVPCKYAVRERSRRGWLTTQMYHTAFTQRKDAAKH
jgi:hypothetical protein